MDINHEASLLSELFKNQLVWLEKLYQPGLETVVECSADVRDICSYWVRKDLSLVKRNMKFLFPLTYSRDNDIIFVELLLSPAGRHVTRSGSKVKAHCDPHFAYDAS